MGCGGGIGDGGRCNDTASKMLARGSLGAQKWLFRKDINLARAA
jgi:hypothetical protein